MAPFIKDKRHLVGIILVAIGLLLILDNITFFPNFIPWWVWTWQFLLITIGVFSLLTTDKIGPGVVLIGIGSIFLISDVVHDIWPNFFHFFSDGGSVFWYLVIIIVGASLILRNRTSKDRGPSRSHSRRRRFSGDEGGSDEDFTSEGTESDFIDEVAIFGGGKKIITSDSFKGGKVTAIFGGSELVFTQSQLAPGFNEIEVFAVFGGWTLVVPPNWQVKSEVVAVFGGMSDKRVFSPDTVKDNTRQLIIKGFVMFGGW